MAAKKKKKKKKQAKPKEIEFNLNFTDVTMDESDGQFDRVNELVEASYNARPVWTNRFTPNFSRVDQPIGHHNWNIKTHLTVESPIIGATGRFELDLKADRSVWIIDYMPSGNPMTCPDLQALVRWSQSAGWKIPQPIAPLVKANVQFWRYMWETLLIDSDYLDERFGARKSLDMREIPRTAMEIAEDEEELEGLDETAKANRREAWKARLGVGQQPKEEE